MRTKVVRLVCDGCGKEMDEVDGTSKIHIDVKGSPLTATADFCVECTGKLPEGKTRKRPVPKTEEEKKAAADAKAKKEAEKKAA